MRDPEDMLTKYQLHRDIQSLERRIYQLERGVAHRPTMYGTSGHTHAESEDRCGACGLTGQAWDRSKYVGSPIDCPMAKTARNDGDEVRMNDGLIAFMAFGMLFELCVILWLWLALGRRHNDGQADG